MMERSDPLDPKERLDPKETLDIMDQEAKKVIVDILDLLVI